MNTSSLVISSTNSVSLPDVGKYIEMCTDGVCSGGLKRIGEIAAGRGGQDRDKRVQGSLPQCHRSAMGSVFQKTKFRVKQIIGIGCVTIFAMK